MFRHHRKMIPADPDFVTLVGSTSKKMSHAAARGVKNGKYMVCARQRRPETSTDGSRGVGMLGKGAVHACVMLGMLTYR